MTIVFREMDIILNFFRKFITIVSFEMVTAILYMHCVIKNKLLGRRHTQINTLTQLIGHITLCLLFFSLPDNDLSMKVYLAHENLAERDHLP